MSDPSPSLVALLDQCHAVTDALPTLSETLGELAQGLADRVYDYEVPAGLPQVPWTRDLRAVMPHNTNCPKPLHNGWWKRSLDQIQTLCFHHTLSHSPEGFAAWYIHKEGGRPGTCYTIWITEGTGEVILCGDLEDGCWHNHNGHKNTALSVGLAGNKTKYPPPLAQMQSAALVAAWAILSPMLPSLNSVGQIMGHQDYPLCRPGKPYHTECPGWLTPATGNWRTELYLTISQFLEDFTAQREVVSIAKR